MHLRKSFHLGTLLALTACFIPCAIPAQTASIAQPGPSAGSTVQASAHTINLDVVVTDKSGKSISDLSQSDFTLLDNGQPAKIDSMQTGAQTAQVILVLDTVNLAHGDVTVARAGISKFLRENSEHLGVPVSVLVLGNKGIEAQIQASTDGNAMAMQIDNMEAQFRTITTAAGFWGETERYDTSLNLLMSLAQQAKAMPGRKLMLWIGPGWPLLDEMNDQILTRDQQTAFNRIVSLSTSLREAHITLYSVSPGMPDKTTYLYQGFLKGVKQAKKANYSDLGVQVLAIQSGGLVLGPDNNLAAQIDTCVSNAGAYYTLVYDPPRAAGPDEYHELKIQLGKPGLIAHTNMGYYNQP